MTLDLLAFGNGGVSKVALRFAAPPVER